MVQFLQILGLIVVVFGFTGLVLWIYSPRNKSRFEEGSRLAVDDYIEDGSKVTSERDER